MMPCAMLAKSAACRPVALPAARASATKPMCATDE